MLTDAAARRLTIYCRRKAPRELVMRDREVREALQAADEDFDAWNELVDRIGRQHGFTLLDLLTEMPPEHPTAA